MRYDIIVQQLAGTQWCLILNVIWKRDLSISCLSFFHNLSRFDSHHIIKNLLLKENEKVSTISRTDEVFIPFSFTVSVGSYTAKKGKVVNVSNALRFFDSFQFMAQGLDALPKTLTKKTFCF